MKSFIPSECFGIQEKKLSAAPGVVPVFVNDVKWSL